MAKLTSEEKVLKYIITKLNGANTNQLRIYSAIIDDVGLKENEIFQSLYFLQSSGYIKIVQKSPHNNFSMPCTVELFSSGFHYFEIKKEEKHEKRNNWIQFWIPVAISILALLGVEII